MILNTMTGEGDRALVGIPDEVIQRMGGHDEKGVWFVYQNADMGSAELGHLQFLKCGPGCTIKTPPGRMPDTHDRIGWRYLLVGVVDFEEKMPIPYTTTDIWMNWFHSQDMGCAGYDPDKAKSLRTKWKCLLDLHENFQL